MDGDVDVDIIDDDGNRVADDEVGHIGVQVTDPWPPGLFKGYFRDDAVTAEAFRNGWYYTGDTATRDADGYIWFVGRSDDIISSASYRISPFEVESALIEHEAVLESAVVAKPDEIRGEIIKSVFFGTVESMKDRTEATQKACAAHFDHLLCS